MNREELLNSITQIGTCEDEIERRRLLTEVSDEVSKVYENVDNLNNTIESLNQTITKNNEDNERIRQENMRLFLKVEEQKTTKQVEQENLGTPKPIEKLSFDDLFKEGADK